MSQKNNIFWFKWDNKVFLKKELNRWIEDFKMKHWDFNISKISKRELEKINLETELTTLPFLASFRLIILDSLFSSNSEKEDEDNKKSSKNDYEKILKIFENVPENNIVLIIDTQIDERTTFYKNLGQIVKVKNFDNLNPQDLKLYIRERLLNIDNDAIDELVRYKNSDLEKIELELDKLELFCIWKRVTLNEVKSYVIPELEVSIFNFINNFYVDDTKSALKNLELLLENSNIFGIFAGLMGNLRNFLYICILSDLSYSKENIISTLKINPFVATKGIENKKHFNKILRLYKNLANLDHKSKIGEIMWDQEEWVKLELQKIIFNLKKTKN